MSKEEIEKLKGELKPYLADYLQELGITPNREGFIHCLRPDHEDKHPSMSVDAKKGFAHCFACGANYDLIALYRQETGKGYREALKDLAAKYLHREIDLGGEEKAEDADPFKPLSLMGDREAIDYLKGRGIAHAEAIAKFCGIKSSAGTIYFPRRESDGQGGLKIVDLQSRALQASGKGERYRRPKGAAARPYDPLGAFSWPLEGLNLIAVTEGEIDALSVMEARYESKPLSGLRPVGLGGVKMLDPFKAALEGLRGDPKGYGFLILTDKDERGEECATQLGKILEAKGYPYIDARRRYPQEGVKDPNEWLQKDAGGFRKALEDMAGNFQALADKSLEATQEERDAYRKEYSAFSGLASLRESIFSKEDKDPIKTGFGGVDALFGGELEKGLILLGAPSSLGKTTLMLQIADQIALSDRRDILFFTLEQAREELIAKSVSRLTYLLQEKGGNTAKKTLDISQKSRWKKYTDGEKEAIYDAFTAYTSIAQRLYFRFPPIEGLSIDDITKAVEEHIRLTGNKPVVFLDYLQIIKPCERARTDKQAVDMNISGLKRLSAKYGIVVFVVSSLSRNYYYEQATLEAFKESGGIEYGADYALGLAYDWLYTDEAEHGALTNKGQPSDNPATILKHKREHIKAIRANPPIPVRLTILKHRNGAPNTECRLLFNAAYSCFSEMGYGETGSEATLRKMAAKALADGKARIDEESPF